MFNFIYLLKRFILPYKKYVFLNILFHLIATLFSLVSFASIIPILQILFGLEVAHANYIDFSWGDGFSDVFAALKNNIYYFIEQTIAIHGASTVLLYLGLFLATTAFLKTGSSYLGSFFMIPIRTGVLRDLRDKIYRKIVSLPIGFYSQERKGDIMSRMTSDVTEIGASIMSSLDMMFKNPIMIIIYLTTLFVLNWQLTVFVLILLPASGFLIGQVGRKLKHSTRRGQEELGEILSRIEETIGGLRVVKAFNAEKKLTGSFQNLNEKNRRTTNSINRRYELAHPMSEFLGTIVIAIIMWYGGTLILNADSSIDAASFIYYMVIFYSIINPVKDLSKATYTIHKGMASLERVDKILNTENPIKDPENPKPLSAFNDKIEYKNLSFRYKEKWVLEDINLTIERGKTIALVGQSGSGKTTLADLLPRYYDVEQGEICINGTNIKDVRTRDLRALMGIVNQEAILFNDTFYNNIAFGVENATQEDVINAAKIANAHDFIATSPEGYQMNIGDRGCKLSGGQRQRISIARAILKNPPILILDEATSALDTESEKLVQDALEKLMKNRTTIVIAHRLSTIKNADEICVMSEGRIVERGKHDDLIALNGYYRRLNEMQAL
ncbi:ABC transporter ATP-binding protein [Bacteroidia bacterium]|nr:ABC transporter ATP-binding protein [Bacteroidia bacterium]